MTIDLDFFSEMWVPALVVGVIIIAILIFLSLKAHKSRVTTGSEGIEGETGEFVEGNKILVHGEIWRISNPEGLQRGDQVKVLSVHGLLLRVEKNQI